MISNGLGLKSLCDKMNNATSCVQATAFVCKEVCQAKEFFNNKILKLRQSIVLLKT